MPIRYVDNRAFLGRLVAPLDPLSPDLQGTHVRPAARTGAIGTQLDPLVGQIDANFRTTSNRVGTIASSFGDISTNIVGSSTAAGAPWQLAAGHYSKAKLPATLICPRPDAETSSWERHRLIPDGIPFEHPIGLTHGAWPFEYTLTQAPAGATVGQHYGDANYGVVTWANPVIGTHTFTVRVRTQDYGRTGGSADSSGEYFVTWTSTVRDHTDPTYFVWMDATAGSDSNSGSFAAPVKTLAGFNALASNGKQLIIRGGTYAINALSAVLNVTSKAKILIGYPGESVTIDYSGAWSGTNCYIDLTGPGAHVNNIRFFGSPSSLTNNFDYYHLRSTGDRNIAFNCTFEGFDGLTATPSGFSNWGGFQMFASASMHKYVAAINCQFKDFKHLASGGGIIWYSTKYWLIEGCRTTGFANARNIQHAYIAKGHNSNGTMRNLYVPAQSISTAPFYQSQASDGGSGDNPDQNETCWCYGVNPPPGNNGQNGSANIYSSVPYSSWTGWQYRCTIIGANFCAGNASFPSTLTLEGNVLCTEHGILNDALHYGSQTGLTLLDVNNALSSYSNRNNVVDPTTGYLLDSYLAANGLTRGTRGHQVI